jgi:hypothetical protein
MSNGFLFSSIVLVIAPDDVRELRMPANCDMASHMQQELAPRQLNMDADDALCHRWRDHHDILAAQLLVERYRHLVVDIAVAHHARHLPSDALLGEAYVGLMRAICRFDPDSGIHFSAYAISWISAAVQDRPAPDAKVGRDHVASGPRAGRANVLRVAPSVNIDVDAAPDQGRKREGSA